MASNIVTVTTEDQFKDLVKKNAGQLVVVHFHAPWADQCKQVTEVMEELAKQIKALFVLIEAESLPQISVNFKITAVPTCILIKNGKEVDRVDGVNIQDLSTKCRTLASGTITGVNGAATGDKTTLEDRLKSLINTAPIMVFMKGNPGQPKCGFSRTLVQILTDLGTPYKTFDILSDEEVRQGLKEFSNWPTYPQLYVKGELIGGLDIIKELKESGELKETLDAATN